MVWKRVRADAVPDRISAPQSADTTAGQQRRARPDGGHPTAKPRMTTMKLVIAIVRPEKANDVLEALYRAEVRGLSISRVQGHGGELERVETYRGTTVKMELAEKVRFEIAVSEEFVEPTISAIREGARTGEVGDGKIFVVPLERVVRIRSGETDTAAVTPVSP
jgi:nitrogen regulatory protein P-II 1